MSELNEKPISYGNLSRFYQDLKNSDLNGIATEQYVDDAIDAIYNLIYTLHPGADYLNFSANLPNTKVRLVLYSDYEAEPSTTIDIDYSFDRKNWTHYTVGNDITIPTDGKVYLRGNNSGFAVYDIDNDDMLYYHYFELSSDSEGTLEVSVNGNIQSLLVKTNFGNKNDVSEYCYYSMFSGCTSLTSAPTLPATTLAEGCYSYMFVDCTSLVTAPELPATTLANYCYRGMFIGCTSLTTVPSRLPATTLANGCCSNMFNGCTSLTTAPELPATTLASDCYYSMFGGCSRLVTAPELPATTLAGSCYSHMFNGCTSLTTAPELPATELAMSCYYSMFEGCSSLNYIKCLATTNINTNGSTTDWVDGVQTNSGTFIKDTNTTWTTGASGIPANWTVQDAQ